MLETISLLLISTVVYDHLSLLYLLNTAFFASLPAWLFTSVTFVDCLNEQVKWLFFQILIHVSDHPDIFNSLKRS